MKKFGSVFIVLIIFIACNKIKDTTDGEKVIPVKVMELLNVNTGQSINYVGTVEESKSVNLSFSQIGTVEEVFVVEGQSVKKGQLLARLNTASAENTYLAALSKLQQAQDAYNRLVKVYENGSLPEIKFVEVETGLQQAKSIAAVSKKNLDDCSLYAPYNGFIATRSIETGAGVMPSMAAFKLVSVDKVFVKISVPESEISKISQGQKAFIEIPSLNNATFSGIVEIKGVVANTMLHTYDTRIVVDNVNNAIMPGMVCKVKVSCNSSDNYIVAPNRAIQIAPDGKKYVWLAINNTVSRCFVETGDLAGNGIIITEGLASGDNLIIEGFQKISEGMKISY